MCEFRLVKVGVGKLDEVIVDIFDLRFFLCVEPREEVIHGSQVFHDQLILDIELVQGKQLGEDILAHLYDIFWLDEGTILQAADYEKEDILAHRLHLHTINIHSSNLEETSHVLENIDEEQSKLV